MPLTTYSSMAIIWADGCISRQQRQAIYVHYMWRVMLTLGATCVAARASQAVGILRNTEIQTRGPNLVATNSSSFVCNTYTSCTQCVSSSSQCDWCVDGNRCTHDTSQNCRNDILITGVSRKGPSYRSGPSFCPTMNSTFDGTNEILVPFGVKKAIKVKVHIIGQFIVQTRFVCQFTIEGRVTHVNAQLLADTIYCDHVELTYSSHAPNMTASFDVIWGGSKSLDNPDNIHVLIYKCNDMADNYDTCIRLPEKFGCGWCQSSNRCEIQNQCGAQNDWLDRTQTRPNTEFHPQKPALIATNSSSFECNAYTSCTQCVSSLSPCDWCVDGHRCTHDTSQNCRNDILITGVSRKGPSYRSGPSFCPTMNSTFDGTNEILVPFGVKKAIKVKVHIIGQFIVQTRFVCQFTIEGRVTHVNAQLLADTIYCDHVELTYSSHAPNMTASFDVIWGRSKSLDNPDNIHVLIYKCNDMADNYDTCIRLPEKFGCGWCQSSNRCEIQNQCGAQNDWLDRTQTRPNTEFHPQKPALIATNSSSFECNAYTSCTQCVSSPSPCDWCVDGHRCTHDTSQNCRNDILITGVSRKGPSYRSGPSFCPTMNSTFDGTNEILVPFDVKKAIKVKVHIIGQFIVQTRFVCQFTIEGRVTHVNAQLLADTIYCDHVELTYSSHAPNMTASFDVIWGGSKSLDNPDNIHVLIYKCNDMADNYDTCIRLPEKFGCGWCQSSNRCEIQNQCGAQNDWLDRTQTRPNTEFHPQKPALIATNSSSFECNAYTSCTQCVSSPSPCDWCVDGHRCTHDTSQNCRNDILITGVSSKGPSYRSGPSFCPTMNSTFDGTNEILVPFGVKKAIKVKVHIIGQFIVQTRFVCQFTIEGRVTHVNAQLLADTIYCDHVELTYSSHAPNMTASFDVIWGGSKSLDNPDNIHVLIYKCNDMADNYDTCIRLPEKFGCGWCQSSNCCEIQNQCGAQNDWLDRTQTRPNTEFHPQKPALIATNSSSFECNAYTSCTQCVSSPSPCDWCVDGHRCTHDTSQNCRNDILVTGVSRKGPSYRSGPSFCPTINSTFDGTNEILVPFGVKKAIKVKVHIIGQFIVQTRFVCQFRIEGRVTHVNAQLLADTIYCDHVELTYSSHAPNMTASFDVIWGGSKSLDNPNNIHILIYKCNDMPDNCEPHTE